MAKVQGKKAAAAGKNVAKKVVARVKSAAGAVKKKAATRVAARPAAKKVVAKKAPVRKAAAPPKKAAKPAPKAVAKRPAKPVASKAKALAKAPKKGAAKVTKAVKSVAKVARKAAKAAVTKAAPAKTAAKTKVAAAVAKHAPVAKAKVAAPAPKLPAAKKLKAVPPVRETKPVVAAPVPAPKAAEPEKKRGRRARTRIQSDGAPSAAWLTTEKPRPASFIPAPPRAEAPSAVAAPPASSDRLIRPDDVDHPAVRTVPIRIDVEQSAGRYFLIAQPTEVSVRPGEGIEWDFRYLGGADISVEEIVVEFEKPSPFSQTVFRTRKPGGARPHRQMSGAALPAAAGRRIEYVVRAMTPFRTELAKASVVVNVL